MDGLAASAFAITSAGLMGYSFALLLVVKKKQGNKRSGVANLLPVFPLIFMFYFALESFLLIREIFGVLGILLMIIIGYTELKGVKA